MMVAPTHVPRPATRRDTEARTHTDAPAVTHLERVWPPIEVDDPRTRRELQITAHFRVAALGEECHPAVAKLKVAPLPRPAPALLAELALDDEARLVHDRRGALRDFILHSPPPLRSRELRSRSRVSVDTPLAKNLSTQNL
jgi:hypothetical protein